MTWVISDDKSPHHPKLIRVGAEAAWLWHASICYSNAHHLDGAIGKDLVPVLYPPLAAKAAKLAERLVSAGLWHDVGDTYEIHDYEDYQSKALKDEAETRRAYERDRKRTQRANAKGQRTSFVPSSVPDQHGTQSRTQQAFVPRAGVPVHARTIPSGPIPSDPILLREPERAARPGLIEPRANFTSKQLEQLFSELRSAVPGGGRFKAQRSDYDRSQKSVEWAHEQDPADPASAARASVVKFLTHATGREAAGWPFWAWANDPGRWFAYVPNPSGNPAPHSGGNGHSAFAPIGTGRVTSAERLAEAAKSNPAWVADAVAKAQAEHERENGASK